KELGIPVLMEGSDRGTIDIERFDLEPERKVLHGMIEHLDMEKFGALKTMDERLPYITAVTGVETLSPRMKGSAIEIMSSISTWPQLASAVAFGGGVTADLARKILLGNLTVSGRFFLDLDELISDPVQSGVHSSQSAVHSSQSSVESRESAVGLISTEEIESYIQQQNLDLPVNGEEIDENTLLALVHAAHLAPSGGNNQPWRFHYQNNVLHLFLEESATKAYLDPEGISSYTSIGAAIENLLLSAAKNKLTVNWELTPGLLPKHVAWFSFNTNYIPSNSEKQLANQIGARHTNRKITQREELGPTIFKELTEVTTSIAGAKLKWISHPAQLESLANISAYADLLRMFIPEAHSDFVQKEMRWNLDEVRDTEDGIGIHTLDLTYNDQIGLRLVRDPRTVEFL
ncbi:MAG: hypothetical protein EOP04_27465, partial [Proteobacteria bacterium]